MSQVPDVKVKSLTVEGSASPGTAASVQAVINNREFVTPLLGPATCGGNTGHKTDVTVEVRDGSGVRQWSDTKTICAEGESIGNEETVQFSPVLDSAGTYTVTASTRVHGKDRDSDTAGPVSLSVSPVSDLPDESGESDGSNRWDWSDLDGGGGGGSGDGLLDLSPDLPSGKVFLGVIALLAIAWIASSTADVAEVAG